jgi:hypothetical protein
MTPSLRGLVVLASTVAAAALAADPVTASTQGSSAAASSNRSPAMVDPKPVPRGARADATSLVALFPAALGPWVLKELERPHPPQTPGPQPLVRAVYAQGPHRAEITARAKPVSSARQVGREVHREGPPQQRASMVVVSLANGVVFAATSPSADVAALEALVLAIDLKQAESLKPAKK